MAVLVLPCLLAAAATPAASITSLQADLDAISALIVANAERTDVATVDATWDADEGKGRWSGHDYDLTTLWSGKTIVFGEEHNEHRENFVRAFKIRHRLVEGASEKSLAGIDVGSSAPNSKYTGAGDGGKALENYWLRAGQLMDASWKPFLEGLRDLSNNWVEEEDNPDIDDAELNRRSIDSFEELFQPLELLGTLTNAKMTGGLANTLQAVTSEMIANVKGEEPRSAVRAAVGAALETAIEYNGRMVSDLPFDKIVALYSSKDVQRYSHRGQAALNELFHGDKAKLDRWIQYFTLFGMAVEALAEKQYEYLVETMPEGDRAAEETRDIAASNADDKNPYTVWSPRRDLAMIKNLEDAMRQDPRPLFVTLGKAHAERLKDQICAIPDADGNVGNVVLIIGELGHLVRVEGPGRPGRDLCPEVLDTLLQTTTI